MNTELLVGGCHSDGDAHKHSFKGCFSQLYAADGVINYGYFNVNCMQVLEVMNGNNLMVEQLKIDDGDQKYLGINTKDQLRRFYLFIYLFIIFPQ